MQNVLCMVGAAFVIKWSNSNENEGFWEMLSIANHWFEGAPSPDMFTNSLFFRLALNFFNTEFNHSTAFDFVRFSKHMWFVNFKQLVNNINRFNSNVNYWRQFWKWTVYMKYEFYRTLRFVFLLLIYTHIILWTYQLSLIMICKLMYIQIHLNISKHTVYK